MNVLGKFPLDRIMICYAQDNKSLLQFKAAYLYLPRPRIGIPLESVALLPNKTIKKIDYAGDVITEKELQKADKTSAIFQAHVGEKKVYTLCITYFKS